MSPVSVPATVPLPYIAVAPTLWLVVVAPAFAFVWQLVSGVRRGGVVYDPWPRRVGIASVVFASLAAVAHGLVCARATLGARALVASAPGGTLVGTLDTSFRLAFDRLSGTACALACVVALVVAVLLARRGFDEGGWRAWAWLELSLAGALLSFLADGLPATLLGWGVVAMSAAWLEGWGDARAGAVRAARGTVAIVSLLAGESFLLGDTADGGGTLALPALLVAAVTLSAFTPQRAASAAPATLAALESGGSTGLVGPFVLLRAAWSPHALTLTTPTLLTFGIASLVVAARRALAVGPGTARWIAFAAGAPTGLTLVALGVDGVPGALLVLLSSGALAAALVLAGRVAPQARASFAPQARGSFERALLGHAPEAGATLLLAFERWVVEALAGSVAVLAHATAWALARFDVHVVGAPADALAARTVRLGRRVEPFVGGSLVPIAWFFVAAAGFAALLHALWPAR